MHFLDEAVSLAKDRRLNDQRVLILPMQVLDFDKALRNVKYHITYDADDDRLLINANLAQGKERLKLRDFSINRKELEEAAEQSYKASTQHYEWFLIGPLCKNFFPIDTTFEQASLEAFDLIASKFKQT